MWLYLSVCFCMFGCVCVLKPEIYRGALNLFTVTPGEKHRGTNHSLLDQTEIQFSLERRWMWTRHDANSETEYPVNCFFFFRTRKLTAACFHLVFCSDRNSQGSVWLKPPCKQSEVCSLFTSNQRCLESVSSRLRSWKIGSRMGNIQIHLAVERNQVAASHFQMALATSLFWLKWQTSPAADFISCR